MASIGNYVCNGTCDLGALEYGGTSSTLVGALNGDSIVNSHDWSLMSNKWLQPDILADLTKDGVVNSLDFSLMNQNWLKTT